MESSESEPKIGTNEDLKLLQDKGILTNFIVMIVGLYPIS